MREPEVINGTPEVVAELNQMFDAIQGNISLYRRGKVNILTAANFINALVVQTNEKLREMEKKKGSVDG